MLFYLPDFGNPVFPESEANHCLKVLRKNKGDLVRVTDGKGRFGEASILTTNPKNCELQLAGIVLEEKGWKNEIWLAVAPTKQSERMEWMVEKCTEIGVDGIVFVHTARTERSILKTERLEKAAISAMKQSGQARRPRLQQFEKFEKFPFHEFSQMFIGDLSPDAKTQIPVTKGKSLLWIGPEGDFTPEEMDTLKQKGAVGIRLGPHILRTETAAIYGLGLFHFGQI